MKINLAKSAGFCFGVKRAIDIAMRVVKSGKQIEMLGDIVHNDTVVKQINSLGIKKIDSLKNIGEKKNLLIRAHGASLAVYAQAKKLNYKIIDATCPMVKEIHKIALNMERIGMAVIVIGDKVHDEVKGIVGQLRRGAIIIDPSDSFPISKLKRLKKAAIVCQSTQNMKKVNELIQKIKIIVPKIKFFNTICRPTQIKQKEIETLPLSNDAIIVIGSKSSANTKRLYQISKALNPKTYRINNAKELKKDWFKNIKSIGITAGASTPKLTIEQIICAIKTRFSG